MTNKQAALVLMPRFMNYDKAICDSLSRKGYEVVFYDNEQHMHRLLSILVRSLFIRGIVKAFAILGFRKAIYDLYLRYKSKEDLKQLSDREYATIICINGQWLSDHTYKVLKEKNPDSTMSLYWWDDASNLRKKSHRKHFDVRYSYNIDDCLKYGFDYLPMFTQTEAAGHADSDEYDIAIIGTAHPDRLTTAKEIYSRYKDKYSFYIYFYHPSEEIDFFGHSKPLSFDEYISVLQRSKAIVDLPSVTQQGPTTRPFDAAMTHTKVITTNRNITRYPIYSENILVINRDDITIDEEFVHSPYTIDEADVYSVDRWTDVLCTK